MNDVCMYNNILSDFKKLFIDIKLTKNKISHMIECGITLQYASKYNPKTYPIKAMNIHNGDDGCIIKYAKDISSWLDRCIYYIIQKKYGAIDDNKLYFPGNLYYLRKLKEQYPETIDSNLDNIISTKIDIIEKIRELAKYAHRYYPNIDEELTDHQIQGEGNFPIECQNVQIQSVCLKYQTVDKSVKDISINALGPDSYELCKQILEHIIRNLTICL